MAEPDRTAPDAVMALLEAEPWRFDFFQALRLIECRYADRPRLGTSRQLAEDPPVRFGQAVSLDFPPSALAHWQQGQPKHKPRKPGEVAPPEEETLAERFPDRLIVHCFGLFGPNGPLPLHLTEYALERLGKRDPGFARFADLFHHRLLCLFYRAWAEAQPAVHYDRHEQGPEEDRFSRYLASLFGLGMNSLRDRDALPDRAKLLFAGLLAGQTRHADGLLAILGTFFGVPVRIDEFVGEWMDIALHEQTCLGTHEQAGRLGQTAVLGARVFGCQHKLRIVLGPLGLAVYRNFLPGGASLEELSAILRNYVGDELAWDVNLVLRHEEIPPLRLDGGTPLGWTSWLGRREGDADDLTLSPAFRP